ncbi:acidic leucine-rich nuclear phosphoprotein 32 family member A isoform X1 [Neocloeon triangulifer]|uniref:acidic leucine-rich nuclear phosphoprotein 32 family member A isoform X1 n=1 Tax=Neocloeon triangulifer TaxID=2078957 RepID=UPI00286EC503|nr:acidic leucine-rich nuclear phosphoprotein 32 family member A isoform X1 [Neocloeon triangulifer]
MEKRIDLEKRGRSADQITELNLDNCRSTSIEGLTDEFCTLEKLSLINVGLTSLKGFPKLAKLKRLELSDNRISGGLNFLQGCPSLTHLNLSGNKIKDLEALDALKAFLNLRSLDLFNNEATTIENYKEKVFNLLPNLKYLDGFDLDDREAEESEADDDDGINGKKDESDSDVDAEDDQKSAEDDDSDQDDDVSGSGGADEDDSLDDLDDEDEDVDDEEEEGAKLADLYKSNLDEEESNDEEWNGDSKLESSADVDDDIESSEDDEEEKASKGKGDSTQDTSNGALPDSEGRGKKRKLEDSS